MCTEARGEHGQHRRWASSREHHWGATVYPNTATWPLFHRQIHIAISLRREVSAMEKQTESQKNSRRKSPPVCSSLWAALCCSLKRTELTSQFRARAYQSEGNRTTVHNFTICFCFKMHLPLMHLIVETIYTSINTNMANQFILTGNIHSKETLF